jgi:hypothetical protein
MDGRSYARVSALSFAVIALLLSGCEVTLNGSAIPLWASWLASVAAGTLAAAGLTVRA